MRVRQLQPLKCCALALIAVEHELRFCVSSCEMIEPIPLARENVSCLWRSGVSLEQTREARGRTIRPNRLPFVQADGELHANRPKSGLPDMPNHMRWRRRVEYGATRAEGIRQPNAG